MNHNCSVECMFPDEIPTRYFISLWFLRLKYHPNLKLFIDNLSLQREIDVSLKDKADDGCGGSQKKTFADVTLVPEINDGETVVAKQMCDSLNFVGPRNDDL